MIYLDNNSTTLLCKSAEKAMMEWAKCYNPSSDNPLSKDVKIMIETCIKFVHKHCGTNSKTHKILFTSGATESNCTILRSVIDSYWRLRQTKPHIITSAIEHHSIIECLELLKSDGRTEVSFVKPKLDGSIVADDVEKEIKENTCLISIMYANNETGTINPIPLIGKMAHEHKIPLHTDCVQLFGKHRIKLVEHDIDALSMSFHKFGGPKGIGMLILSNFLIEGYELHGIIHGTQQYGLRGGTENPPLIAAGIEAIKCAFSERKEKNLHLLRMKNMIIEGLLKKYPKGELIMPKLKNRQPVELVILGSNDPKTSLPNTILLSIVKSYGETFCNVQFKKMLYEAGVIVSIASACLTSSPKASHVLYAMDIEPIIRAGVLRISLGDDTKIGDVKKFLRIFISKLDLFIQKLDKK